MFNPYTKLYKKLRKMAKRYDFTLKSMHNIPHNDGGTIKIKIEWGRKSE